MYFNNININGHFQPQNTPIWLGGQDINKEGSWIWQTSGDDIEYSKFQVGEPNGGANENCLLMYYENGNWMDIPCTNAYNYHLCERLAPKPALPPQSRAGIYQHIQINAYCYIFLPTSWTTYLLIVHKHTFHRILFCSVPEV